MLLPNRHGSSDKYRYGFNGKEKDDELKGEGNSYDFGARMLDSRVGRWFAVDPLFIKYPYEGNYNAFGNNPILYTDIDGREIIIYLSNGTTINYKPGIKLPNDKFGDKIVKALNRIHSTGEGEIVVNLLTNSKKKYNINQSDILFAQNEKQQKENTSAEFSLGKNREFDKPVKEAIKKSEFDKAQSIIASVDELFIGAYDGNYELAWKLNGNNPDGVKMNFEIALAHELFHAYQFEAGSLSGEFLGGYIGTTSGGGPPLLEAQAVGFENYIRSSLFTDTEFGETRGFYSGNKISEFFVEPSWTDILIGHDKLDVIEFKKTGRAFSIWKQEFSEQAKSQGDRTLKK